MELLMRRWLGVQAFSYVELRSIQISTVFAFTIFVQEWLRYPRAGWTGFAVMMIYAGFDNGTTIFRTYHRFLGVLLGLFTGYLLWFVGHLDYRTLILIMPLMVFFAFFLVGRAYSVPTVFTVNVSVLGSGYFSTEDTLPVTYFIIDYTLCTLIAFTIILGFEYFWFRHYGLMQRFIKSTQAEVIDDLYRLVRLLNQGKIKKTEWFQACIKLTDSLFEVNKLITNSQFLISSEHAVGDEFNQFVELANRIFIGLKALYMAYYTKHYHTFDYYQLFQQVQKDLVHLKDFVAGEQTIDLSEGVKHATSG
ncbi:TPA: FUSC family protein [Legionella pneumophila subsp. pneumophila]|nr:FUSC family protein [Legionella pneumophila]HAT8683156.1 FUSC family protein [Legionella pneumophila subsp. pneumophila ATCC 43283]HAT8842433.1 FUSC family protein [Legionella pneumophila subsp. pneumophila]HAT6338163.1 FUSC family protein [Legionella pneumophila]HAT6373399.1 FUSC family protein [Legionella pneumophila]